MAGRRWVRIVGDGVVYLGPCWVYAVVLWPDSDEDYTDVYDGRDATSGKKFCRVESGDSDTLSPFLGSGVPFDVGIYVDGKDGVVETTVVFEPLD